MSRSGCRRSTRVFREGAEEELCEIPGRHLPSFPWKRCEGGCGTQPRKGAAGARGGGCPCSAARRTFSFSNLLQPTTVKSYLVKRLAENSRNAERRYAGFTF